MLRCSRCLYPETTRPFIHFDEDGICSGCRVHDEKSNIDWTDRESKLRQLVSGYKRDSGYDCIIGVSGGKDSHFQVHYVTKVLGLRPLLVTFNHLDNSEVGIRNLTNLVTKLKLDHIRFTPNPEVVRKMCRHASLTWGDPFWHEHAGIYSFPSQIAVKYNIPLIIWGEYGFSDLVGIYSHNDFFEMNRKGRKELGLRGMEASDFLGDCKEDLTIRDLEFTKYPDDSEIERVGLRGIYLGNYLNWNSIEQTKLMIELYDFETADKERTFNIYENAECYFNDSVHDYMKFLKFGYNRAVDHACQLIRLGYITRDQGILLVNKYNSKVPDNKFYEFCRWIEVNPDCLIAKIKEDEMTEFGDLHSSAESSAISLPFIKNHSQNNLQKTRRFM